MEWLTGNSFFVLLLLVCVGMHFFGHGHGHQHGKHGDDEAGSSQGDETDHRRKKRL